MDGYSGTCGDSVNWEYDPDTGTLRIYGSGAMYDYDNFRNCAPWYDYCFDIKKCVIESGVTYIGTLAFYECEYMTEIVIGDNVTSFGNRVFEYSGLERYTVSENNSVYSSDSYGVLFNKNKTELIECRLHGINVYEMPDSVEYISSSSFIHSRNITSITISKNVISIEQNAFDGQGELTTIIFKGSTPPNMGTLAFALGRNYIEPITATVYTTGWGSDDVFTTDIRGSYTAFIYETLGGSTIPSFVDVTFSSNPVKTGVTFIVSVNLEVVESAFTWDGLSAKTWDSVKTYTWNDLKGE